jgi:hypothetical protein
MKSIAFSLISLGLLTACSSELAETANDITGDKVMKVTVQSYPFEFDDDTRTTLTASDKSITFSWTDYDAMGVFSVEPDTCGQVKRTLSIPVGTDTHHTTFDGAGWELNPDYKYGAYMPYNSSLPSSVEYYEVPIDLTGQDGTLETISKKYDYMYASSSTETIKNLDGKDSTKIVFDFEHAIAIIQLNLTMPVAAEWKSVTLTCAEEDGVWKYSTIMNVATGEIDGYESSSEVTLSLENVSTTASDKTLTLYVAVLPTTAEDIVLTAVTSDNKSYTATLKGKAFKAGKAYRLSASLSPVFTQTGYKDGYAYVDLGLPSGVKWATMNIGATSVTDFGKYYAWGETKPQASNTYDWSSYKWCDGTETSMTKYCTKMSYGTVDNKTVLDPEDDAAVQNWGGVWRMPTNVELEELVNNCYWVWTSSYNNSGVDGCIVYAAKSPSDKGQVAGFGKTPSSDYSLLDAHVFLPAAGYCFDGLFCTVEIFGSVGTYWSSSIYERENDKAGYIGFISDDCSIICGSFVRSCGFSVRAVCE